MIFLHFLFALIFLGNIVFGDLSPQDLLKSKRKLKVLVNSPSLGWSHMQFQGKLADLLVEAGHEVHILNQHINPLLVNYTGSKLVSRIFNVPLSEKNKNSFLEIDFFDDPFNGVNNMLTDGVMTEIQKVVHVYCEEFLENEKQLIEDLTREQYDVAISEFIHPCFFGIFQRIGVHTKLATNTFLVGSIPAYHFGIPAIGSYVTNFHAPSINGPRMNFWERTRNFVFDLYEANYIQPMIFRVDSIFKKAYGNDFPSVKAIMRNISLGFFNSNEFLDLPRPISNKVIYIGGVVESKKSVLTKEFQQIFDKSQSGVVLFSFGSLADTKLLNPRIKEAFFRAFAKFPTYDFIWKFESSENDTALIASAQNVHMYEWVDQRAILAQPKLKAFITHCGMNSLNEAASSGTPLVAIPLFADQLYNAAAMKEKGMGVYVDILEAHDEAVIIQALSKILNDPKYGENARLLKKKIELAPWKPAEKFVKMVEFAAEFTDFNELNLPRADEMGFLVFYSLDVIGVILLVLVMLVLVVIKVGKFVFRRLFSTFSAEKLKKV